MGFFCSVRLLAGEAATARGTEGTFRSSSRPRPDAGCFSSARAERFSQILFPRRGRRRTRFSAVNITAMPNATISTSQEPVRENARSRNPPADAPRMLPASRSCGPTGSIR